MRNNITEISTPRAKAFQSLLNGIVSDMDIIFRVGSETVNIIIVYVDSCEAGFSGTEFDNVQDIREAFPDPAAMEHYKTEAKIYINIDTLRNTYPEILRILFHELRHYMQELNGLYIQNLHNARNEKPEVYKANHNRYDFELDASLYAESVLGYIFPGIPSPKACTVRNTIGATRKEILENVKRDIKEGFPALGRIENDNSVINYIHCVNEKIESVREKMLLFEDIKRM